MDERLRLCGLSLPRLKSYELYVGRTVTFITCIPWWNFCTWHLSPPHLVRPNETTSARIAASYDIELQLACYLSDTVLNSQVEALSPNGRMHPCPASFATGRGDPPGVPLASIIDGPSHRKTSCSERSRGYRVGEWVKFKSTPPGPYTARSTSAAS
jgi:hypothetical protein